MVKPTWIVSTARSGTTYLCDVLNRTGEFSPELSERLNLVYGDRGGALRRDPGRFRNCKVFPEQLRASRLTLAEVSDLLPGVRFVSLRRRSLVDRAVSLYLAQRSGVYTVSEGAATGDFARFVSTPEGYAGRPLPCDAGDCMTFYARVAREESELEAALSTVHHRELTYESLVSGEGLPGLFRWLGLGADPAECAAASQLRPMPPRAESERLRRVIASMTCKV